MIYYTNYSCTKTTRKWLGKCQWNILDFKPQLQLLWDYYDGLSGIRITH